MGSRMVTFSRTLIIYLQCLFIFDVYLSIAKCSNVLIESKVFRYFQKFWFLFTYLMEKREICEVIYGFKFRCKGIFLGVSNVSHKSN